LIGPDAIYKNDDMDRIVTIGKGLADMIPQSFFFDPKDQSLYLNIGGEPAWFSIEVGVRSFALTATKLHDVVVRGLEMRHNRQPGGQWPLVAIGQCQRVMVEDCKIYFADTVAENATGIVAMTRGKDEPARNTRVLNNLLISNYVTGDTITRGSDLTLEMSPDPAWRSENGSESEFNVFANNAWTPWLRHNWNDNNSLRQWQKHYRQDLHSRLMPVAYQRVGTGFKLLTRDGLDVAGPLPETVRQVWQPRNPRRVGADLTQWPRP
jgi:hypothetical protein